MNHILLNASLVGLGGLFGFLYSILLDFEVGFYLMIGFMGVAVIHFGWMCFVAPNEYNSKESKN